VGNRAYGERLAHLAQDEAPLRAVTAILLLAPQPPMLFMGEEWAAPEPFPYFCDFGPELAQAVRDGRRREFAKFERFRDDAVWQTVPDAVAPETFESARLHWENLTKPRHAKWLTEYRHLLEVRHRAIVPLVPTLHSGRVNWVGGKAFTVHWPARDGQGLRLWANLAAEPQRLPQALGPPLFSTHPDAAPDTLPGWCVVWAHA
jgi:maltooligosyltrehalose trehalohydrolase